jgi:hypothetical protein
MPIRTRPVLRLLWLMVATQAGSPVHAAAGAGTALRPSDCRPRDADSTCATAVAGAPVAVPPQIPGQVLYDGPLGGVPASGYAYWGFDFLSEQTGQPSPVRPDEFINRSAAPVTVTLSFNFPTARYCGNDCLPGVEFVVGPGWSKVDPPYVFSGNTVSLTYVAPPGQGYGWLIGLWQAGNPHLRVSVPLGARVDLQDVGLPPMPAIATEVGAVARSCDCWDGTTAACSDGNRFSNGLLGPWTQVFRTYLRAGAFNNCPPQR